ncbi:SsrA-binding protein [Planctomycetes bacterium Pan216]|uniref:SsrA-binding protein n=1 Tax=Kolteria novifilia TaxID=2527975 RepID=A0A518BAP8_9BACT|nr:SsrA-binding protein [Planctomycetes bacterium Pan216]
MSKSKKSGKSDKTTSSGEKIVCRNRRARHDYEITDTIEAGIVLTGTEAKSLRAGKASLEESYARVERDEVWLIRADIPEYAMANIMNHEPKRKRKLLLHRREIAKFAKKGMEQGFTLIPLQLYFKRGRAKVQLGLGRGKRQYDKRESLKEKTHKREMERARRSRG